MKFALEKYIEIEVQENGRKKEEIYISLLNQEGLRNLKNKDEKVLGKFLISAFEKNKTTKITLKELESCDYYRQNPTITFIQEKEQNLVTIDTDKQFKLGKLIHKAAYNNAWYAKDYINKIVFNPEEYPFEFLKGICSIIIEDSSTRGYIYVRDELLSPINLLIHNLENNTDIANIIMIALGYIKVPILGVSLGDIQGALDIFVNSVKFCENPSLPVTNLIF